jgi:hypothetical protein
MRLVLLIGVIGLVVPIASLQAQTCGVGAGTPIFNSPDRIITGQGGRGPSCTSGAVLTVRLKRDVPWWFDKTLATTSQRLQNGDLILRYSCHGAGSQRVYVEVTDGKTTRQSQRLGVNYCG